MKVLIVSAHAPPIICGIGDYSEILCRNLNERGAEAFHVGLKKKTLGRFFKGIKLLVEILKINSHKNFDIIHLQYEAFSFEQSFILPLYFLLQKKHFVITFHEVFQKNQFQIWRDQALLKKCQAVIVNDNGRALALKKLAFKNIEKIHCIGVGTNLPVMAKKVISKDYLIGYFGFINAVKRLDILFESFHIIKQKLPKAILRLVGDFDINSKEIRKWKHWINENNLTDSIEWCGACEGLIASQNIQECQLIILPFSDGASPRRGSLQACLALGKAILTSLPEFDEPTLAGLLMIKLTTPEKWAVKAIEVLQNKELCLRLEEKAVAISQHYSWSLIADRHLRIYKSFPKMKDN